MSTGKDYLPHEDRTAQEPRGDRLHPVTVGKITQINDDIKIFRLDIEDEENGIEVCASICQASI